LFVTRQILSSRSLASVAGRSSAFWRSAKNVDLVQIPVAIGRQEVIAGCRGFFRHI